MAKRKQIIFLSDEVEKRKTGWYIKNASPDSWSLFPYFPVKRRLDLSKPSGFNNLELGLIFAFGKRSVVYLQNVFAIPANMTLTMFMNESKRVEYPDVESLLDDGWRGD